MESGDDYRVYGTVESGKDLLFNGVLAPVRKPLISSGAVTGKDNDIWMSEDYGYVIRKGTQLHKQFRAAARRLLGKFAWRDALPVYKENGVYNFYVQSKKVASAEQQQERDVCPQEAAAKQQASAGSGSRGSQRVINRRQGQNP